MKRASYLTSVFGVLGAYVIFLTALSSPAVAATSFSPPYNNSVTSPASTQSGGTCTNFYSGNIYVGAECAYAYDGNGWEPMYADANPCCGGRSSTQASGEYDANGNGPMTTSTSGYLYLIEGTQYYGVVQTNSPSAADAYLKATLTYHYTYCFNNGNGVVCNPASVNNSPVIWDAVMDGNAVLSGSASWAHLFTGVSSGWMNQYWASEGGVASAYGQSNCFFTCTNPDANSNFNSANYYIYINYIEICNYQYCSPS